jgi:hypothetical protein
VLVMVLPHGQQTPKPVVALRKQLTDPQPDHFPYILVAGAGVAPTGAELMGLA